MNFNKRFNIQVEEKELQRRFLNRFENIVVPYIRSSSRGYKFDEKITRYAATMMGIKYPENRYIGSYPQGDFYRCLQLLEYMNDYFKIEFGSSHKFGDCIRTLLDLDEGSGVEWRNGKFYPKGAKLLDKEIVNNTLDWLKEETMISVYEPFEKGLKHFL